MQALPRGPQGRLRRRRSCASAYHDQAAKQGIRDISYDEQTGDFLVLLGRSTSTGDEPFQLCAWNGSSDNVELLDVSFHRSMKPEGVVAFSSGDERKLLIVDDRGGYAVFDYPESDQ